MLKCPKGALLFRLGREVCPIILDPKILSRLIFLDLAFCLPVPVYIFGFSLG